MGRDVAQLVEHWVWNMADPGLTPWESWEVTARSKGGIPKEFFGGHGQLQGQRAVPLRSDRQLAFNAKLTNMFIPGRTPLRNTWEVTGKVKEQSP